MVSSIKMSLKATLFILLVGIQGQPGPLIPSCVQDFDGDDEEEETSFCTYMDQEVAVYTAGNQRFVCSKKDSPETYPPCSPGVIRRIKAQQGSSRDTGPRADTLEFPASDLDDISVCDLLNWEAILGDVPSSLLEVCVDAGDYFVSQGTDEEICRIPETREALLAQKDIAKCSKHFKQMVASSSDTDANACTSEQLYDIEDLIRHDPSAVCTKDEIVSVNKGGSSSRCRLPPDTAENLARNLDPCQTSETKPKPPNILRVSSNFVDCIENSLMNRMSDVSFCFYDDQQFLWSKTHWKVCIIHRRDLPRVSKWFKYYKPGKECTGETLQMIKRIVRLATEVKPLKVTLIPKCSATKQKGFVACFLDGIYYRWHPTEKFRKICRIVEMKIPLKWTYCMEDFVNTLKGRMLVLEASHVSDDDNERYRHLVPLCSSRELRNKQSFVRCIYKGLHCLWDESTRWICQTSAPNGRLHEWGLCPPDAISRLESIVGNTDKSSPDRAAKKRKAEVNLDLVGPPTTIPKVVEELTQPVKSWAQKSYPVATEVRKAVFHLEQFNNERKKRQTSDWSSRKILLKPQVIIGARMSVSVRRLDVQRGNFPADLQRSLKQNVDKFDGGEYRIEPGSIRAVEITAELSRVEDPRNFSPQYYAAIGLGGTALVLLLVCLVYFAVHHRQRRNAQNCRMTRC